MTYPSFPAVLKITLDVKFMCSSSSFLAVSIPQVGKGHRYYHCCPVEKHFLLVLYFLLS